MERMLGGSYPLERDLPLPWTRASRARLGGYSWNPAIIEPFKTRVDRDNIANAAVFVDCRGFGVRKIHKDKRKTPDGCGASCSRDHSSDGNCLVCGMVYGRHSGHSCPSSSAFSGRRGSWTRGSQPPEEDAELFNCIVVEKLPVRLGEVHGASASDQSGGGAGGGEAKRGSSHPLRGFGGVTLAELSSQSGAPAVTAAVAAAP